MLADHLVASYLAANQKRDVKDLLKVYKKLRTYGSGDQKREYAHRLFNLLRRMVTDKASSTIIALASVNVAMF